MLDQNRKDCLIFSMVQCATNYSDWDVQMVFSVLDTEETKFANEYLFNHNL